MRHFFSDEGIFGSEPSASHFDLYLQHAQMKFPEFCHQFSFIAQSPFIHLHFLPEHITACNSQSVIAARLPSSSTTMQSFAGNFGVVSNDLQTTEHGCAGPLL